MKYYFSKHDTMCYTKEYHIAEMIENNIPEMEVWEAKREHGTGMFWCMKYQDFGETIDSCGKQCDRYQPRNGKTGICKSHRMPYEQTDTMIVLKNPNNQEEAK